MSKELAFSITKRDLKIQYFRAGGPGGQNQNKRDTACRITHMDSGVSVESRTHRTQLENKLEAFRKLTEHPRFKAWIANRLNSLIQEPPEDVVKKQMSSDNLLIEGRSQDGNWVTIE